MESRFGQYDVIDSQWAGFDRSRHTEPSRFFGENLDTLGVPFNEITDSDLTALLTRASKLVPLDLEGNTIDFDPISQGVDILWREESRLHRLNVSCNSFTI